MAEHRNIHNIYIQKKVSAAAKLSCTVRAVVAGAKPKLNGSRCLMCYIIIIPSISRREETKKISPFHYYYFYNIRGAIFIVLVGKPVSGSRRYITLTTWSAVICCSCCCCFLYQLYNRRIFVSIFLTLFLQNKQKIRPLFTKRSKTFCQYL